MSIKIAKWKDAKQAPVTFVIDDLANIYVKKSPTQELKVGEDWGHCSFQKNAMWDFLNKNLLKEFPHIKTTFLLVTDKRATMTIDSSYTYNENITHNQDFIQFLKQINQLPTAEIAYHGTTHGKAGEKEEDFVQEWDTYKSLDEAISTINKGKELFKTALGVYPEGGKYCGYKDGEFGNESLAKTNFKWWYYYEDYFIWDKDSTDNRYDYDLRFTQGVVNIPTTVDASNLSLKILSRLFTRKYLKSLYLFFMKQKSVEKHIESLYNNSEVISVYEHSSPYMSNGTTQYPNIISDIKNLNLIFSILSKKDIWYATSTELANYFIDRENTTIEFLENNCFKLLSDKNFNAELTITIPLQDKTSSLYDENDNFIANFLPKNEVSYLTFNFEIGIRYKII